MKNIIVQNNGIIHYLAHCTVCGWSDAIEGRGAKRNQRVRNAAYSHIRKTGHSVAIEAGHSTHYFLDKS